VYRVGKRNFCEKKIYPKTLIRVRTVEMMQGYSGLESSKVVLRARKSFCM
jgi:hypothetical protein